MSATYPILDFFKYEHLPEKLQAVSKKFAVLAHEVADLPVDGEVVVALRKLLEAKDAAVRATLRGLKRLNEMSEEED